jgi:hypothetical protein
MKLVPRVIPVTGDSATRTVPLVGRSRPDTNDSVVDFPHPVGPTTAQNCPGSTVRFTSLSAVNIEPDGVRNCLVTPSSSTRAAALVATLGVVDLFNILAPPVTT